MIVLESPLDMHLHLRDGEMLKKVAPLSSKEFAGALIMPNLIPPVTTKKRVVEYKEEIEQITKKDNFTPYMTLFFKSNYDLEFLKSVKEEILAIKLYPSGVTTNSQEGVKEFDKLAPTLEAMSELGIVLAVHGESNGFVMEREREFLKVYEEIAKNFPNLKIVMEHITTKDSVELLGKFDNLFATITIHHLYLTLDDLAGGLLRPHLFCKPILKTPKDKEALQEVALSGYEKVMFGSDSAPHPREKKEAPGCAAGVFNAPVALSALAQLFAKKGKEENLQKFVSTNAQKIYNIKPPKKVVKLVNELFKVPNEYEGVVPLFANEALEWRVESVV